MKIRRLVSIMLLLMGVLSMVACTGGEQGKGEMLPENKDMSKVNTTQF